MYCTGFLQNDSRKTLCQNETFVCLIGMSMYVAKSDYFGHVLSDATISSGEEVFNNFLRGPQVACCMAKFLSISNTKYPHFPEAVFFSPIFILDGLSYKNCLLYLFLICSRPVRTLCTSNDCVLTFSNPLSNNLSNFNKKS